MPKWSPDGTLLAYQDFEKGVMICKADGSAREEVVADAGNPYWIDGKENELAFLVWGRTIESIHLETGKRRSLVKSTRHWLNHGYAFASDGNTIYYTRGLRKSVELMALSLDVEGAGPACITRGPDRQWN